MPNVPANDVVGILSRIVKAAGKWSCSILGGLALLAFVCLALSGKQGSIKIPGIELSVQPSPKTLPAACRPLLSEVTSAQQALTAEGHRLDLLEQAAIKYQMDNDHPNDHRGWDEVGASHLKGLQENIAAQRKLFAAAADRLTFALNDVKQRCEL